ncbi:hypothetical protein NPIL_411021 [Nephila pilipes]|uniref:Uncharacterized protein n=1 Tax=Nephila pilipes TaxID=299642 RepID=A0A8X6JPI5_NEPPI|nr:hypothetical protein NPIL_411021 [Nephila pilipes]
MFRLESKGHPCDILIARDSNYYAATPSCLPVTPTVAMATGSSPSATLRMRSLALFRNPFTGTKARTDSGILLQEGSRYIGSETRDLLFDRAIVLLRLKSYDLHL